MSKTFVRFSGKEQDGLPQMSDKPTIWHPGKWRGHNPKYPCDDPVLNKTMVGDHVYEYVGTIREVAKPKIKKAKPFVIGQMYHEALHNGKPSATTRKFIGTFQGELLWSSTHKGAIYYRTKLDGSGLSPGKSAMLPTYEEVDGGFEYQLVKEN